MRKATEEIFRGLVNVFCEAFGSGLLFRLGLLLGFFSLRLDLGGGGFRVPAAFFGMRLFFGGGGGRNGERRGALDAHFEGALHFRVEVQGDLVFAERLDGRLEVDLLLVERDVELVLEFVGDHASGHGTEKLSVIAGLDLDDADQLGEALGEFRHGVELMRFAFGALLLEGFKLAFVRRGDRHGEALGEKIVARVTGGDFDRVGFTAQANNVVSKDNFSFCHTKNN